MVSSDIYINKLTSYPNNKGTYEENKNEVLMLENIYHPHCIECKLINF